MVKENIIKDKSYTFALSIIDLVRKFPKQNDGFIIGKQLVRSGTSIGANVEEGQASQSEADFISKYSIACKEARETYYWLRLLAASEIFPSDRLAELETECNELVAILATIVKKMRSKQRSLQTSHLPLHTSAKRPSSILLSRLLRSFCVSLCVFV